MIVASWIACCIAGLAIGIKIFIRYHFLENWSGALEAKSGLRFPSDHYYCWKEVDASATQRIASGLRTVELRAKQGNRKYKKAGRVLRALRG